MACLMVTSITLTIVMLFVKATLIGIKEMIREKMAKARDRAKIGEEEIFGFRKRNYVREFPS